MLKRGYYGSYHKMSPEHLNSYVNEFSVRHNMRELDSLDQMTGIVRGSDGKLLRPMWAGNGRTCPSPNGLRKPSLSPGLHRRCASLRQPSVRPCCWM